MFEAYKYLLFVNDRLQYLVDDFPRMEKDLAVLKNDFFLLKYNFAILVSDRIENRPGFNEQALRMIKQQVRLFLDQAPENYDNSNAFRKELIQAAEHISQLSNIDFSAKP
ncbi:hypothetical protein JCM10914_2585 [Paenibacillus sp. JCM 10914]|nr:hypothetical protein JCM10914_2585 [Paenibacillus sp. JCM 10914]